MDFLRDNWLAVLSTLGAIIVWLSERQKRRVEGRIGINDATEGMQQMYNKFVDDADTQYQKMNEKITKLESIIDGLLEQQRLDKDNISKLERRVNEQEITIKSYEQKISEYEIEVQRLKRELNKT